MSKICLDKKISVLMSVFNETESEIKEAIESVLNQTYSNLELIIVNDNPFRTELDLFLVDYAANDDRIIIIKNESNLGLALSMNEAFKHASGNYVARMDSDDISELNRFEQEVRIIEQGICDFVFTNYNYINEDSRFLNSGLAELGMIKKEEMIYGIIFGSIIHHPTVMFRREIFERVGGYRNFPCAQDQDLWIRMAENGCKFAYIDYVLLHYRIRNNSISQSKRYKQFLTIYYIKLLMRERMRNQGKDSFSVANYNAFIDKHMKNAASFDEAREHLLLAKNSAGIQKIYHRTRAFICSKEYRQNFLFSLFNKKRVCRYMNVKKKEE